MADKSQRNQFKKKVTTCPLLLSLFLLGSANATKTGDPTIQYNVDMDSQLAVTAATALLYQQGTAISDAAASGAASTPAGCVAKCKNDGDPLKHTACIHTRTYSGSPLVYADTCVMYETAAADALKWNYPLKAEFQTGGVYKTGWAWNLNADMTGSPGTPNPGCPAIAAIKTEMESVVGKKRITASQDASGTVVAEQQSSGLYELIGDKLGAGSGTVGNNGYTQPTTATGIWQVTAAIKTETEKIGAPATGQTETTLFAAIGAPQQAKTYKANAAANGFEIDTTTGADPTGLYARIGGPAVAAQTGTIGAGHKAAIATSGLWEKIGSPAVAGIAVGGTDGTLPTTAGTNTPSTGLYKHIGDPAVAAVTYSSANSVTGKIAIPVSGMYKSIADKAVTSCPTEAQIKEVIKTTEPKAPADGAEARFAATLLASAAALAALV